nr:hypothetical protein [Prolixibacteraceae bacterium]
MKNFETMANLVLGQLDQIEELLNKGEMTFTEEESIAFKNTEKEIDNLEVKLNDRIIKTIVLY